jgi:recombination protein RecT
MSNALTTSPKTDIRDLIQSDRVKQQLALVLPKHLTPDRMARVAITAIMKTPKLGQCTKESLLQALMLCSQAGLEPDGRNAHLIPYGDQVQVIFDWKGLVSLAKRNGIQNIAAEIVCENDDFDWYRDGDGLHFKHRIDFRRPRGAMFAAFCIWKDGDQFDGDVMTKEEIDAIRKRSRASGAGPWVTDYNEMAKKTVVRRSSKKWPLDAELAEALNDADSGVTVKDPPQPSFKPRTSEPVVNLELTDGGNDGDLAPAAAAMPTFTPQPEPQKATVTASSKPVAPPEPVSAPEIAPEAEKEPAAPAPEPPKAAEANPLAELRAEIRAGELTVTQVINFCIQRNLLKEGADKDLATLSDIRPDKVAALTKNLKARGTVYKQMKGEA